MADDTSTPFDVDLETAYRQALEAVSATELADHVDWTADGDAADESADVLPFPVAATSDIPRPRDASPGREAAQPLSVADPSPRVTPRQILEAALFVGGVELTAAKLASLLKGDFTTEFVERTLRELNRRYADEGRSYEICCDEGRYRLALRDEFEQLRRRVYGLGPREVKLTQDALEVLSVIAYRQPISRPELETIREGNSGNVLRQLLRRQLVAVRRDEDEVRYTTTSRFLEVFGVASLEELPRTDDRSFK